MLNGAGFHQESGEKMIEGGASAPSPRPPLSRPYAADQSSETSLFDRTVKVTTLYSLLLVCYTCLAGEYNFNFFAACFRKGRNMSFAGAPTVLKRGKLPIVSNSDTYNQMTVSHNVSPS